MSVLPQITAAIGEKYVLTGGDTADYVTDWTGAYSGQPLAVLRPADTAQVAAVLKIANENGTPVVPVSGHTGLTGATLGTDALILSLDRLSQITKIDPKGRTATVGAGVILSTLHDAVDAHDLIFPLTFGARGSAMIGGVLSTNAGGSNVVRYGNTRDLCLGVEVVMADGRIMNLMSALHKDNSGLNLRQLVIGAEGTLGIITAAVMKLWPKPRAYGTAMVAVPSLDDALDLLNIVQDETGGAVEAFEYMPRNYIDRHMALVKGATAPFAESYDINILLEVGATAEHDAAPTLTGEIPIISKMEAILGNMLENGKVIDAVIAQNEAQRRTMWERREQAGEIVFQGGPFVNTDVAVPIDKVGAFEAAVTPRLKAIDPDARELIVAHLGDGNIHHTTYTKHNDPSIHDAMTAAVEDVVQELGGSFSAEHGIGLSKLETMRRRKDPVALDAMRAIKAALDPKGILNPGKVIPD
ncbi:FAD-binding oxidoreductase [Yoonia sediminilitoris]|uniref:FAD/FMN-containing dehydrogenase n=1 Tax=Yoonia sediminilitoris TaxID=1286148 RepID=A0A2T6K7P1_9RHOB|nr:FAD-binding oxidoreductase [Yoonia sediminilitoris]PUB10681.1 FAD/FMN-containing dehydrogenase [Yoonia sediminilitoris]RCW90433.1 FAD/FMN-containing dehydrogenase [Yoonia sediminilitoris]